MSSLVLDCSVSMAWCFEDEADALADQVLESLRSNAARVPILWTMEVTNVLLVAERRGRILHADAQRFLELLRELPIEIDDDAPGMNSLLALGREYALSAYDAAYLELAMRLGLPLATRDERLRQACVQAGVPDFRT